MIKNSLELGLVLLTLNHHGKLSAVCKLLKYSTRHIYCTIKIIDVNQEQQSPDLVTVDLVKNLDLVKFSLLTEFL